MCRDYFDNPAPLAGWLPYLLLITSSVSFSHKIIVFGKSCIIIL